MAVSRTKLVVFTAVLVAAAMAVLVLPVLPWLTRLFESIAALGPWGPIALIGVYIISCVFLIPASIPTFAAGILFGVFKGSLVAMAGGVLGACAAYWIGRFLARDWMARRIARSRRITALDNAVDEHGLTVVILSRLSPIAPYVLLNYAFGLTNISFWKYLLGTLVGVAPAMVMYVYVGAGLRSLTEIASYAHGEGPTPPVYRVFFWVGLVVTAVVTVLLMRLAQKVLRRERRQRVCEERAREMVPDGR
jgi:uncharacterized membrane protein YdjX (TVP38/TMEM64 family)